MDASVYVLSRVDKVSSQHVRELIRELRGDGVRFYTDSKSDLVIKECLALGVYPLVETYNLKSKPQTYVFASRSDEARIEEIKTQLESLGDKLTLRCI